MQVIWFFGGGEDALVEAKNRKVRSQAQKIGNLEMLYPEDVVIVVPVL